jgi:uncharacterized protein (DUF1330 family)
MRIIHLQHVSVAAKVICSDCDDPGYSELKAMGQRSTTTNMILVEGIPNA